MGFVLGSSAPFSLSATVYLCVALHGFCLLCMGLAENLSTVLKPLSRHKWLLFLLTHLLLYFSLSTISFQIFSLVPWEFLATCFDLYPLKSQTLSFLYLPKLRVLVFKTHQVQFVLPKYWVCGFPLWRAWLTRGFGPPPSTQQLPGTSLLGLGVCAQLPSLPWKSGLSSHKPCACSQNRYDFMGAAPLLCVEDTVALYFPSICGHCVLSLMIPEF